MEVKNFRVAYEGEEAFVIVNDVKVAKRTKLGTPEATHWASLEPGWTVHDVLMKRSCTPMSIGTVTKVSSSADHH